MYDAFFCCCCCFSFVLFCFVFFFSFFLITCVLGAGGGQKYEKDIGKYAIQVKNPDSHLNLPKKLNYNSKVH